jgi:hypothetical protein
VADELPGERARAVAEAILYDPHAMPVRITVFCDTCGVEDTRDYLLRDDMPKIERLAAARRVLVERDGWQCTPEADLCPRCAAMPDERLAEIEQRDQAATAGPWQWFGNTDVHDVYLATPDRGRLYVMQFARWGMSSAQPVFRDDAARQMVKACEAPVYEVAPTATSRDDPRVYRADISGLRNADAEFIAASRQDVTDLLAEVRRLRALVPEHTANATD